MSKLLLKKQELERKNPTEISNRVFLGNYSHILKNQILNEKGIGLVISCLEVDPRDRYPNADYLVLPIKDQPTSNISQYF